MGTETVHYGSVGQRLKAVRARLGKSQEEMANAVGIPIDSYKKYEGGSRTPGGGALARLGIMGVDLTWLLTGRGSDDLALTRAHHTTFAQQPHAQYDVTEAFAMVPVYDIRAAAGHGALVEDLPASEHWAFSRAWLSTEVKVPANRLCLVTVSGNSMEPDLHDGDVVMVDRGDVDVLREGVYVFLLEGHVFIKELALQGNRLAIRSRNPEHPGRELSVLKENSTFRLIGRVIGKPVFQRI